MSVSSCRCMFVSCVHHVAVFNAAFCMTCSLLMLTEDARGDHIHCIFTMLYHRVRNKTYIYMEDTYLLQSWSHNCLVGSHECVLLFVPSCCSECFYDL